MDASKAFFMPSASRRDSTRATCAARRATSPALASAASRAARYRTTISDITTPTATKPTSSTPSVEAGDPKRPMGGTNSQSTAA